VLEKSFHVILLYKVRDLTFSTCCLRNRTTSFKVYRWSSTLLAIDEKITLKYRKIFSSFQCCLLPHEKTTILKFVQIVHGIKFILNIFDFFFLHCWLSHCCFPHQDKIDYKKQTSWLIIVSWYQESVLTSILKTTNVIVIVIEIK